MTPLAFDAFSPDESDSEADYYSVKQEPVDEYETEDDNYSMKQEAADEYGIIGPWSILVSSRKHVSKLFLRHSHVNVSKYFLEIALLKFGIVCLL